MDIMNMMVAQRQTIAFQRNHASSLDNSNQGKGFKDHLESRMNAYDTKRDERGVRTNDTNSRDVKTNQDSKTNQSQQSPKSEGKKVAGEDLRQEQRKLDADQPLEHDEHVNLVALVNQLINFEILEEINEVNLSEFEALLSLKELVSSNDIEVQTLMKNIDYVLTEIEMSSQDEKMVETKGQLEALISELNHIEMKSLDHHADHQPMSTIDKTFADQPRKLVSQYEGSDIEIQHQDDESAKVDFKINPSKSVELDDEVNSMELTSVSTYQKVEQENKAKASENEVFIPTDLANDEQNIVLELITQGRVESFDPERIQESTIKSLIDPQELIEKLVDKIKFNVNQDKSEMQFQLKPENLGRVSVKVSFESGEIIAKVYAESIQVKEIIEANLNQLRDALTEQGLAIGQLDVSVGQDPREAFQQFDQWRLGNTTKRSKEQNVSFSGSIEAPVKLGTNPYLTASQFDHLA